MSAAVQIIDSVLSSATNIIVGIEERKKAYQEWLNNNPIQAKEYFDSSTKLLLIFVVGILPILALIFVLFLISNKKT